MRKRVKLFGLLGVSALLAACQSSGSSSLEQSLLLNRFVLTTINGQTPSAFLGLESARAPQVELIFQEDMQLAGSSGCNRFFGPATLDGNELILGEGGLTRMMCPPALMKFESQLLTLLRQGVMLELSGETLTLLADGGWTLTYVKSDHP